MCFISSVLCGILRASDSLLAVSLKISPDRKKQSILSLQGTVVLGECEVADVFKQSYSEYRLVFKSGQPKQQ